MLAHGVKRVYRLFILVRYMSKLERDDFTMLLKVV